MRVTQMKRIISPSDLMFIDFEASSLSQNSWPIEVGLAFVVGGGTISMASLIQPFHNWDPAAWTNRAAQIHGISRSSLATAPEAPAVAGWVREKLQNRLLVSDAPEYDSRWLAKLMMAGDLDVPEILDFDTLVSSALPDRAIDHLYEKLARIPKPHRAERDALRLARAFEVGWKVANRNEATFSQSWTTSADGRNSVSVP